MALLSLNKRDGENEEKSGWRRLEMPYDSIGLRVNPL